MPIVPATPDAIRRAAQALARGEIVAFPTETVYGLAANALDARAVAKVFAAKERPRFNPLIVHVQGLAEAREYGLVNEAARKLASAFWPGPLTLVMKRRSTCGIADLVSGGVDTIALRAPAHPVAQALLAKAALPLAGPSANRSGRISPTAAAHVEAELGDRPAMILDGGPSPLGIESTVVSVVGEPALLRPGAVPREAIERVLGAPLVAAKAAERAAGLTRELLIFSRKERATPVVIDLNDAALAQLACEARLEIVPGATHLFEEPGTLQQVARLATEWFQRWL